MLSSIFLIEHATYTFFKISTHMALPTTFTFSGPLVGPFWSHPISHILCSSYCLSSLLFILVPCDLLPTLKCFFSNYLKVLNVRAKAFISLSFLPVPGFCILISSDWRAIIIAFSRVKSDSIYSLCGISLSAILMTMRPHIYSSLLASKSKRSAIWQRFLTKVSMLSL